MDILEPSQDEKLPELQTKFDLNYPSIRAVYIDYIKVMKHMLAKDFKQENKADDDIPMDVDDFLAYCDEHDKVMCICCCYH